MTGFTRTQYNRKGNHWLPVEKVAQTLNFSFFI